MKKWLLWILCGVLCTCVVSCRRSDEWKLKVASLTLEYGEDPYADVKLQDVLEYPSGSDEREVVIVLLSAQGEKIDEEQASAMTPLAVGGYTVGRKPSPFRCRSRSRIRSRRSLRTSRRRYP